jgi:cation-transporting ATPase E
VRDGAIKDVTVDQIVLDDVLELHPGDQVPIDGVLLAAQNLEVNESLLTGEADPVPKSPGDQVLSGSFIMTGSGRLRGSVTPPIPVDSPAQHGSSLSRDPNSETASTIFFVT